MDSTALLNSKLKLRHFALALSIAEHGSILRAAEHLYITQPVVSRGLRELEGLLGVPIFERGPQGVIPTIFAPIFLEHARAILGHVQQTESHIAEIAEATSGEVRVGTFVTGGNLLLPRAISWLKHRRPRLAVRVREATPDRLHDDLVSGQVDLVVGRLTYLQGGTSFRQVAYYREPFQIVARVGHPIFEGGRPRLEKLREFPWIFPAEHTVLRRELINIFTHEMVELPDEQVECSAPMTVRAMVAEANFLAVLPHTLAKSDPLLRIIDQRLDTIGQTVGVTLVDNRTPKPSTSLMLRGLEHASIAIRESIDES